MKTFSEHFVEIADGKTLKYLANSNTGKPKLLMLHGVNLRSEYFSDFFPFIADDYDIFAPDFRGHGKSFRSDEAYSLDNHAKDIGLFIDRVMPEPFFLLGMSLGGRVGLIVTAQHPDRVRKLVVVDVGPDVNPAGLGRMVKAQAMLPDSFHSHEALRAFYFETYQGMPAQYIDNIIKFSWYRNEDGTMVKAYHKAIWNIDQEAIVQDANHLNALLAGIETPVLVVRGGVSDILTQDDAIKFVQRLQQGKLVEIPGTTHGLMLEEPALCADAVKQFFAA